MPRRQLFPLTGLQELIMRTRRQAIRISFAAITVLALAAMTGCGMMSRQSNLVAFTTQLRAANEVPPNSSKASGSVDAVFNKDTNLFRWKVNFRGLTGPATAAHFHGPAAVGSNAGVVLPWTGPISNPMEGRATLTPAQAADLLAGRWYANIHTAAHPAGELRGQMSVVRN
jgi:hypothetical protein